MIATHLKKKRCFRHDLTHNVRRRVRTNNYEYLEDRGSEINNHPVHTAKLSKGLVESFFSKLFYFVFMAALSPIKTFEFMTARIAWILNGFRFVCLLFDTFLRCFDN